MKILTYNLRNGATDTYDILVDFIKQEKPDIVCVQEANGWTNNDSELIQRFADRTGLKHFSLGNSNTDFKLVTFSKQPIISSQCITEGFWHSALKITVPWNKKQLTVWNIHLDPRTPAHRQEETMRLLSHINQPVEQIIITGDFNSISPADDYSPHLLKNLLAAGIQKFGTEQLSYDAMTAFIDTGLIDTMAAHNSITTTVPTAANQDEAHAIALRLDYFMTSPDVNDSITSVSVIKNHLTNRISDHYPIALKLH